ncbi:MAG: hypothetical protein ACREPT_00630 [Rudaea sp.]
MLVAHVLRGKFAPWALSPDQRAQRLLASPDPLVKLFAGCSLHDDFEVPVYRM